jgi:hypothetical protein
MWSATKINIKFKLLGDERDDSKVKIKIKSLYTRKRLKATELKDTLTFVVCAVQLMGDPACSVLHFHTTAINPRTEVQLAPTLYGV